MSALEPSKLLVTWEHKYFRQGNVGRRARGDHSLSRHTLIARFAHLAFNYNSEAESGLLVSETVHTEYRTRRNNVKIKTNLALDACLRCFPQGLIAIFEATALNALQQFRPSLLSIHNIT